MAQQPASGGQGRGVPRASRHTLARLLHKPVQLEDIKTELERAMLASSRQDLQQTVVANRYLVLLNPRDYGTYMYMQHLPDELQQHVLAQGQRYGLRFGGFVRVELWPEPGTYLRALSMFDSRTPVGTSAGSIAGPGANGVAMPPMSMPPALAGTTLAPATAAPALSAPIGANGVSPAALAASNLPTAAMPPPVGQRGYTHTMAPAASRACPRCQTPVRPGARFCNRCGNLVQP
jgi:hypothetical protein